MIYLSVNTKDKFSFMFLNTYQLIRKKSLQYVVFIIYVEEK